LKSKTCKGNDKISGAVAVDSVFAPGFSNQKPFTKNVDSTPANGKPATWNQS
jgi:hypothetical protein